MIFTEPYTRKAAKFIKNHPDVENLYAKTLQLLEVNPHHASLRLHPLKGKLDGLYSVSINLKYRITLTMIITEKELFIERQLSSKRSLDEASVASIKCNEIEGYNKTLIPPCFIKVTR